MSNKRKQPKHIGDTKKEQEQRGFCPGVFRLSCVQCFHGFLSSSKFGNSGFAIFGYPVIFRILGVLIQTGHLSEGMA